MNTNKTKQFTLRFITAALVAALLMPFAPADVSAQGRGKNKKNKDKKEEKFKNGHDARDGRYDGRGPDRDRRDRDDDDDDDDNRDRRDRDRDNDGVNDVTEIRRVAVANGYDAGVRYGQDDRRDNERYNYQDIDAYRDATGGYRDSYGSQRLYRQSYQQGFRQGYEDGYNNRPTSRRRSRIGDILGGILGGQ